MCKKIFSNIIDDILADIYHNLGTNSSKNNSNQKGFEKMLVMEYICTGIGKVKMTVGVKRRTHEKIQYCITALAPVDEASNPS